MLTLSVQRFMISDVKCGNCFKYESLLHIACVTICANSMAATAGDSQPFELKTSTQACISLMAWKKEICFHYYLYTYHDTAG